MTSRHIMRIVDIKDNSVSDLPGCDRFEPADHKWSQPEIDALTLALASRRPLLVRGEPGSGKSQLARAAAVVLGSGSPIVEVIHPRFEAMDLLYRFDVVARLADAQAREGKGLDASNERYVQKGMLWKSFVACKDGEPPPVLLIDEIDKADADVPNSLLEVLGNRSFTVAPLYNKTVRAESKVSPMIIITTNEERELPAAFVRRCVVLNLNPPKDDAGLTAWLLARVKAHRSLREIDDGVACDAVAQVLADRRDAAKAGFPKVGLAEAIDLLTALGELASQKPAGERVQAQRDWLQRLSAYALVKHANQDQKRAPHTEAKAAEA